MSQTYDEDRAWFAAKVAAKTTDDIQDLEKIRDQLNRFIVNTYESLGHGHPARLAAAKARDAIVVEIKKMKCKCLVGMKDPACAIHKGA